MRFVRAATFAWTALLCASQAAAQDGARRGGVNPAIFNDAFTPGHAAQVGGTPVVFDTAALGSLRISSGLLVACDPLGGDCTRPFTRRVPVGEFPVVLAVARAGSDGRPAFAKLAFTREPVVRWEMATTEGQNPARLQEGEIFGYPVDSGTGAFVDAQAWSDLEKRVGPGGLTLRLINEFRRLEASQRPGFMLAEGPLTAAIFVSGLGDGTYATYWGFDARGNLAAALTDFSLVEWSEKETRASR